MKPSRPAPTPATRNVPASQGLIPDPPVNPAPLPGTGFRSAPGNQMRNQQSPSFRGGSRPPPPPSQPAPPNQPVIRPPGTQQTGFRLPPINQGQWISLWIHWSSNWCEICKWMKNSVRSKEFTLTPLDGTRVSPWPFDDIKVFQVFQVLSQQLSSTVYLSRWIQGFARIPPTDGVDVDASFSSFLRLPESIETREGNRAASFHFSFFFHPNIYWLRNQRSTTTATTFLWTKNSSFTTFPAARHFCIFRWVHSFDQIFYLRVKWFFFFWRFIRFVWEASFIVNCVIAKSCAASATCCAILGPKWREIWMSLKVKKRKRHFNRHSFVIFIEFSSLRVRIDPAEMSGFKDGRNWRFKGQGSWGPLAAKLKVQKCRTPHQSIAGMSKNRSVCTLGTLREKRPSWRILFVTANVLAWPTERSVCRFPLSESRDLLKPFVESQLWVA